MAGSRRPRTLQRAVELAGVGLHSGKRVRVQLAPTTSADGGGIAFRRRGRAPIRADAQAIDPSRSLLCTQLRARDASWRVSTVEHLMAALVAARVTHADVNILEEAQASEMDQDNDRVVELPILDGSAAPYVQAVRDAGVHTMQDSAPAPFLRVHRPVQVLMEDKAAWFLPIPTELSGVETPSLHLSVQVNFCHKGLGTRFCQFNLTGDADANLAAFEKEIAPARTFTFEDEIGWMQANNLALGGSLENAVVFQPGLPNQSGEVAALNPDGLRFADEWVRHKMLDCIGDLGLVGMPVHGYFFATSPGHALTHRLVEALLADPATYTVHE